MVYPMKVAVYGALGKMGTEVLKAVSGDVDLQLVGAIDIEAAESVLQVPGSPETIPFSSRIEYILEQYHPEVIVDFTRAEATMNLLDLAARHKANLVIGSTGFTPEDLTNIDETMRANELGAIVAPNFALGAVIMIHMAKTAARYFDWAEIIELHHEQKVDAPSGTAVSTAKAMIESKCKPFLYASAQKETIANSRGGEMDGIAFHSVRMPGLCAHQEVIFGSPGQTLSIRHDTINRECYMPGVLFAIKNIINCKGMIYGLDKLLGLDSENVSNHK